MTARKPPIRAEVLTLAECAHYLRISERHARELAASFVIPNFRLTPNGPRLVRLDDLRAVIAAKVDEQRAKTPIDPATDEPVDIRRVRIA